MNRKYFLDGKIVDGSTLIAKADEWYGCQAGEIISFASVAAKCLRNNGHTVKDAIEEKRRSHDKKHSCFL